MENCQLVYLAVLSPPGGSIHRIGWVNKSESRNIVSETGEIEAVLPVEKTVLAESQNQATALYLIHIEANVVSRLVSVPYMTAGTTVTKYASLREVSCELIK